jgi:hypothetical protein
MDTVRYRDYDGRQIVIGFDRLNVDAMATRARARAEMDKTDLGKRLEAARLAIEEADSFKEHKDAERSFKQLAAEYQAQFGELLARCVVYFQPRAGELVLAPDEIAKLREAYGRLQPGEQLTTGGEIVRTDDG